MVWCALQSWGGLVAAPSRSLLRARRWGSSRCPHGAGLCARRRGGGAFLLPRPAHPPSPSAPVPCPDERRTKWACSPGVLSSTARIVGLFAGRRAPRSLLCGAFASGSRQPRVMEGSVEYGVGPPRQREGRTTCASHCGQAAPMFLRTTHASGLSVEGGVPVWYVFGGASCTTHHWLLCHRPSPATGNGGLRSALGTTYKHFRTTTRRGLAQGCLRPALGAVCRTYHWWFCHWPSSVMDNGGLCNSRGFEKFFFECQHLPTSNTKDMKKQMRSHVRVFAAM